MYSLLSQEFNELPILTSDKRLRRAPTIQVQKISIHASMPLPHDLAVARPPKLYEYGLASLFHRDSSEPRRVEVRGTDYMKRLETVLTETLADWQTDVVANVHAQLREQIGHYELLLVKRPKARLQSLSQRRAQPDLVMRHAAFTLQMARLCADLEAADERLLGALGKQVLTRPLTVKPGELR